MKRCSCGITYTAPQWDGLPLVGSQLDGDGMIELRNCACGSTIAVALGMGPGATARSAADRISVALADIGDGYPAAALHELQAARDLLGQAIAQLKLCVDRRSTSASAQSTIARTADWSRIAMSTPRTISKSSGRAFGEG